MAKYSKILSAWQHRFLATTFLVVTKLALGKNGYAANFRIESKPVKKENPAFPEHKYSLNP